MNTITIKPKTVSIDPKIKKELKSLCEEEGQVIIHCRIFTSHTELLRIWKNTYLVPHCNPKKLSLLTHAENITFYPQWTRCKGGYYNFSLFFKRLPKDCEAFDLIEDIPESGGFFKKNIKRNKSDVYKIEL